MWRDAVGSVSLHETLWYNKSFPMTPAVVSHTFDCYCETGLNDDGINQKAWEDSEEDERS